MTDTAASGNWNVGGTWVGGVVPTTTTAVIKAGHTVTVTANVSGIGANTLSAVAIQIENGATLAVNPSITIVALGDVQVSGALTVGAGGFVDVRAIAEGSTPPPGYPVTRFLTINSSGVVTANGTSTSPARIGSTVANAAIIDGTGALNATYTSFAGLYGMSDYFSVFPEGAGISRFHATALWEYNMVTVGMTLHNARVASGALVVDDAHINSVYYDAALCYYQIEAYTGDSATWRDPARLASDWQRGIFEASDPDGAVQAFYVHVKGLGEDFLIDGDTPSKNAALAVSLNSAYAGDSVDDGPTGGNTALYYNNREAALTLHSYLVAKDLGQAQPRPRYDDLLDFLYGHWEQIIDEVWVGDTHDIQAWMYIGLAFRTLWWDWTTSGDSRFLPKLLEQVEYFWENGWDETEEVFLLDINPLGAGTGTYPNPAPDVMLLVTPVFAFLWLQTGDSVWRDRYDTAFAAAVRKGYLGDGTYITGKQFNEKYIWSFQGQAWRAMEPVGLGRLILTRPA